MPEITIHIGGREFDVVCKAGEEPFLQSAAALLDAEAQALVGSMGRIPESRMLLMSGLMLADKTASLEDQLAAAGRANEGGPLASEVTAEIAQLKGDLKATTANLKTAQDALAAKEEALAAKEKEAESALEGKEAELKDALTDMEKQLSETQANLTYALEAIERMVVSLEKKGAA